MLPEQMVVEAIEKYLVSEDMWFMKTHGDRFGKSGIPDIIVCCNGNFVTFEVKRHSGGKQSNLQKYNQEKIRDNKGVCEFITEPEDAISILKKLKG